MAGPDDNTGLLLSISAEIARLEKSFDRAAGVVKKKSKEMVDSGTSLERFFGKPSLGKALDKTFDATRFKILDSGAARVGLFGSALEALGPAGLTAAAGIGAMAAALAGARDAAKFADDINDTAARLHVTTDALQEFRYAVRAAGGEEKGADEALEAFSVTLGKAQAGVKKGLVPFKELGFTPAQIKGFKSAEEGLAAVVKRMEGLSDAQRDAVIAQFGLEGLKPLIAGGADEMARLRDEAHKVGIVMDSELVKRGGALNDEMETLQKVIDVQLKSALVDLGPILVGLLKIIADMARFAGDVADNFRSIENRRTASIQKNIDEARSQNTRLAQGGLAPSEKTVFKHNLDLIAKGQAELDSRKASAAPTAPVPTRSLRNAGKTASTPKDSTVQRTEQVEGQIAAAEQQILQALLGLTQDVEARASLQKQIIDAELAQAEAHTAKEAADIKADKGLSAAKKRELVAQLEVVDGKAAEAAILKKQAIDREAANEKARQQLALEETQLAGQEDALRLQQSLTTSDRERADIALRLVQLAYEREKAELEAVIATQGVSAADRQIAEEKLRQLKSAQPGREEGARRDGSDAARRAGSVAEGVRQQGGAVEARAAELAEIDRLRQQDVLSEREAAQAKAQINAEYHSQRLAGAQQFFGGLATLSESNNSTLAAIGKAAAITQATIDGVLAVQKALASLPFPFNIAAAAGVGVAAAVNVAKIAGLKDGGWVSGPGGPQGDGVLRRLSDGEHVTNARAAKRNRALLDHINAGGDAAALAPRFSLPSAGGASSVTNQGGDAHLTYAPQITNPDPDLARLLDTQGTAMIRFLKDAFKSNLIKRPGG